MRKVWENDGKCEYEKVQKEINKKKQNNQRKWYLL